MSTFLWVEIVCDGCSAQAPGRFTSTDQLHRAELKAIARRQGWTFADKNAWCKACTAERAAKALATDKETAP